MDLTFTDAETEFRDELRAWLADNDPGEPPAEGEDASYEWRRNFQRRLAEAAGPPSTGRRNTAAGERR